MKSYNRILAIVALAVAALSATAQNDRSAYFLDDYTYRFQLNPAFANSQNFIAMPGLGNIDFDVHGTLAVKDLIYNRGGKTVTFLNPAVGTSTVLNRFDTSKNFGLEGRLTLLGAGFKAFGGYNTITVGVRMNEGTRVPKQLIHFMKSGIENKTYNIKDLSLQSTAWAEVALSHSHDINSWFRLGVTAKLLVGAGYADAHLNRARLELNNDNWIVTSNAEVNASVKGLEYKTKVNKETGHTYVSGAKINSPSVNGFGAAFDIGAVFKPGRDWEVSLAILDLGFIHWNNNMVATTNGNRTFETDAYTFNVNDKADNSFKNEWERMRDDLSSLYELDNAGDKGAHNEMIASTLNVGLKYTLPAYRNLNFGLMNTTHIQHQYSWTDFRLSANITPCKWFGAGINYSLSTFGSGMGWIVNFHPKGFNLFLGMDRIPFKVSKEFIPLSSNASFNFGINFPF